MGTCQTLPCLKCYSEHLACGTPKVKPQVVVLLHFLCSIIFFHLLTPVFFILVTVQCTKDAHFIVVVARDASLPNINLESISLRGQGEGCTHVDYNSGFAIYYFPVTACGTVVRVRSFFPLFFNQLRQL